MVRPTMAPDAAFRLEQAPAAPWSGAPVLLFFKGDRFFCWDVATESLRDGGPRPIATEWPGLLETVEGRALRGALHVPAWGGRVHFFFEGDPLALAWNVDRWQAEAKRICVRELLPSRLTAGDFTPVVARASDGRMVIYAFSGLEYTRWSVVDGAALREDDGYPRGIQQDWKDGLLLAPRSAIYVDWPNRSRAHSNRKLYFFMGDLYLRWDVPTHTRNYRLDIATGWKGWPMPALVD